MMIQKAVVLLSGGLDSATCLAFAQSKGFEVYAMSFDYGQRHKIELAAAKKIASRMNVTKHIIVRIDLRQWGGSALTSEDINVPEYGKHFEDIPVTYVPARNIIFLSFAVSWAEALSIKDIFIGVNSVDYSGYPDCRPEFIKAFAKCINIGTKSGQSKDKFTIHTPLQFMSKAEIIRLGVSLNVDYSLTHSCYNPDTAGNPCRRCDSCVLRQKGFEEAGMSDPLFSDR